MITMTNSFYRNKPRPQLFWLGLALLFAANLSTAAEYYVVNANSVKVREGPSTQHPGVTQLNLGHIVTKLSEQNDWTQIAFRNPKLPEGKREGSGWMASRFLTKDLVSNTSRKKNKAKPEPQVALPDQNPQPAKAQIITAKPPAAATNTLVKKAEPAPAPNQVQAQAQAASTALSAKPHQVTGQGVKVRRGPGSQYISFTQLYKGNKVLVLKQQEGWSNIKFTMANGEPKQGWTASRFLQALSNAPSTNIQSKQSTIATKKPAGKAPKIKLSLGQEKLVCERGDNLIVSACTIQMSFKLSAADNIKKIKVRCEADLLVGIKDGNPLKFPLKQEQNYLIDKVSGNNKSYLMEAKLETRGNYTVSSVDLISHRCGVIAFSRT